MSLNAFYDRKHSADFVTKNLEILNNLTATEGASGYYLQSPADGVSTFMPPVQLNQIPVSRYRMTLARVTDNALSPVTVLERPAELGPNGCNMDEAGIAGGVINYPAGAATYLVTIEYVFNIAGVDPVPSNNAGTINTIQCAVYHNNVIQDRSIVFKPVVSTNKKTTVSCAFIENVAGAIAGGITIKLERIPFLLGDNSNTGYELFANDSIISFHKLTV